MKARLAAAWHAQITSRLVGPSGPHVGLGCHERHEPCARLAARSTTCANSAACATCAIWKSRPPTALSCSPTATTRLATIARRCYSIRTPYGRRSANILIASAVRRARLPGPHPGLAGHPRIRRAVQRLRHGTRRRARHHRMATPARRVSRRVRDLGALAISATPNGTSPAAPSPNGKPQSSTSPLRL